MQSNSSATVPGRSIDSRASKALRPLLVWPLVLSVGVAIARAQTAYPLFTQDDFARLMKSVGANWGGTSASIAKGDFDEAKARLTRSREQLAVTITFWRDNQKTDAVKMLRDTLARLDELDGALSVEQPAEALGASAARVVDQVDRACEACHEVYRDRDPVTQAYRLKPGSVAVRSGKP